MSNTPRGAPELTAGQATPETTVNRQIRYTEAGASHFPVKSRVTAPAGSCADGDSYLIKATASGLFTGKEGQLATAVGSNAANGWYYHTPIEGFTAWVMDEDARYLYNGSAWAVDTSGGFGLDTDGTLAANSDTVAASQKATKTYVDGKVAGLSWKQAVRAATTANGTLATAFANGQVIDGVTLATGNRILIKNQTTASENGIYVVAASGSPTRATDADAGAELVNATVYVSEGTTQADTQWTCTTNATITVGSTSLTFAQINTGSVSLASTTEVLTGTDTSKVATPDAIAALWEQGSDVASAGTVSLGEGGFFHVTGTTTITAIALATDKAGRRAWVDFTGALTLTHNASTLILPTGANITTAAGDTACFVSEGSGVIRCLAYQKASGAALSGGGGGGGSAWRLSGGPLDNEPPASNYATLDTRNSHPVLNFDTTTQEAAAWTRAMPSDYSGAGITVNVWCAAATATSGTIGWLVSIERINASGQDINSDGFASANTVTATTVPGTSGQLLKLSVNISSGANMDSLAAGELFRIKIERDVANDNAAGDAQLLRWEMVSQ